MTQEQVLMNRYNRQETARQRLFAGKLRAKLPSSGQRADRVESAQHLLLIHPKQAYFAASVGSSLQRSKLNTWLSFSVPDGHATRKCDPRRTSAPGTTPICIAALA
jgi:hypothetical protein